MQPQGFKEVISTSSGSSRPASEHTLRAGTCCPSAAMPGSEPSHEVAGVIFPPGLESNKDSLLLAKCWGWEVPCPLDLAKRKSKLQVIWPKPADAAQKSHSGCCETGKSQSKCSPRKHTQSCLVLERQPLCLDAGSAGRTDQRALLVSRKHQPWDSHSALGPQRPSIPKTPRLPTQDLGSQLTS